jgi:O-antigen ligase
MMCSNRAVLPANRGIVGSVQRWIPAGSVQRWIPAVVTSGFVMAGFVKDTGILVDLPVDLTLALALVTALIVGMQIAFVGIPREAHGVVLAFTLLVPPVLWSATTAYGTDKVGRLFTFTFLSLLAPVVLIRDLGDVARFVFAFTGMSGIVVVTALFDPKLSSAYVGAPITTESVDTIGLGSAAGHVLVVLALGLIWRRIPRLAILGVAAAVYVLLQSGSRGPLFSAALAVLVGSLLVRKRPAFHRIAVFLALLAAGVVIAYEAAPLYSQLRIIGFLEGDTSGSIDGRISLYHDAVQSILNHPFGIGWGSFAGITFGGYTYPHDLVLETLAEAGVVFGGLFLLWMVYKIIVTYRITTDYLGCVVFATAIFWCGKALVSGDINDNRVLLYAIGLAIAACGVARTTSFTLATGETENFWRRLPRSSVREPSPVGGVSQEDA